MAGEEPSYTAAEVARILRISRFTVYELIKRGELEAFQVGRRMRVDGGALARFKARQASRGGMPAGEGEAGAVPPPVPSRESPPRLPEGTLLLAASHDLALEALVVRLRERRGLTVLPTYVGSLEALLAVRGEVAHAAGIHIWNAETGEYNAPTVRRLWPGQPFCLLHLATRRQGFLLPPGNPRGVRGWEDLARADLRLVNRQAGAGTRMLLDLHLRRLGIAPTRVAGYGDEVSTHLEAGVAVLRRRADLALGIEAVARALGLDFLPLHEETYEIAFPASAAGQAWAAALCEEAASPAFRALVEGLDGYGCGRTGTVRRIGGEEPAAGLSSPPSWKEEGDR